jgi:hypothetical protein
MPEMRYQWEEPFVIDDTAFRARFGATPEDADRAAAATVEWARSHYGSGVPGIRDQGFGTGDSR